jgi:hypothetical protein
MTTNNTPPQPSGGEGVPERRVAPYTPAPVPDTPQRIYIRTRYANDVMGGVYHLERSERDMIEYARVTQPATGPGDPLPRSMETNISSIARHIAAPAEDQGADVTEVIQRATDALTLLVQKPTTPTDVAEKARRATEKIADLVGFDPSVRNATGTTVADIIIAEFQK